MPAETKNKNGKNADSVKDLSGVPVNELRTRFEDIQTDLESIDNKYESDNFDWSVEDQTKYSSLLDEAEQIREALNSHPETLRNRREALNLPDRVADVSRGLRVLSDHIGNAVPAAESDPRFGYKTDNEFLMDVISAYRGEVSDRMNVVLNAVGSDEYTAGGWKDAGIFIPESFINQIIRVAPEDDQLLGRMTEIPMGSPTVKIPAAVDKNHTTSFTGGTRVYRTSETQTVDLTKDKFEMIGLDATEIVGASAVTKNLLRFSPVSIPSLIQNSMQAAMSYKRREEIVTGDGKGKYLGFLNPANPALQSLSRPGTQSASDILNGQNILTMRKYVWDYDNAVWVFNWDLFDIVAQLHIESPNAAGIIKLYSPQNGDVPETLLGRPIVWTEFMPGIQSGQDGNTITEWGEAATGYHYAACVNMTNYYHGMLYTDQAVSAHVRFLEREEVFQFVMADDARPSWLTTLTPKRGVTARSPFVALKSQ